MVDQNALSPSVIFTLVTIGLVLHIIIASGVFGSASEHGMSPIGWTILYLVTGPIGWLIFWIARDVSSLGGSSMRVGSMNRLRLIDQRHRDLMFDTMMRVTPYPSRKFNDDILLDLICRGLWHNARKHAEDMRSIALDEGDRRAAEDYRRMLRWIDSRRNPFAGRK